MLILHVRRVPGAILLSILASTLVALSVGLVSWSAATPSLDALAGTAFQLNIPAALKLGALDIVFVVLFVDLFDNLGTLLAVTKEAGLARPGEEVPRLRRILLTDSISTMAGSLMGTSTVVSYVESAAGVAAGGRSGVTAIVTGVLFLLALPLSAIAMALSRPAPPRPRLSWSEP